MKNFALGLLLGIIGGGAGVWYFLYPPPGRVAPRIEAIQQDGEAARQQTNEPANVVDELMAKLEAVQLTPEDIREELSRTGKVVRRNTRKLGNALNDAATDARITASIKAQLLQDPELSAWGISVSTTNRRVTLSGEVVSPELIGRAMLLALQTEGVDMVISTLEVEAEPV